jgi:TRAP transporter 4TM/12TM fusion protein
MLNCHGSYKKNKAVAFTGRTKNMLDQTRGDGESVIDEHSKPGTGSAPNQSLKTLAFLFFGAGLSLLHIYFNVFALLPSLVQNGIHFAGFAFLCVLVQPIVKRCDETAAKRVIRKFDILFGLLIAVSALYVVSMEDAIYARGVRLNTMDWICGGFLIVSAIELTRRTTGWIIPTLIILALTYVTWWGSLIGGVFSFSGLTAETILFRSIYGDDGLFGNIARISSTFVFMFILFGAFLIRSGAGDFVIELARAVAGKTIGGPGLVAVIASGLTGTISGSAVANTASTGVITIPLMKKAGFPAKFAAGVEAAASTGGQLMPPIMGAGAFVMASYTQIPYTTIVAVSFLPALLYFFTVAFFVRIEAKKRDVKVVDEGVKASDVLKRGGLPFLLPVTVLIGLLVIGYTATYAAGISILAIIVASWFTPNKMGPKAILEALALGARNMVLTAVLLCSVGLIVNVIATAGIGNTFSLMITQWAGDSLFLAIALIAVASLVLGMGLPVTAAYIVLGTLSAPALYNLIADIQLMQAFVDGTVPVSAQVIVAAIVPEFTNGLSGGMSQEAAQSLFAVIPSDLMGTLREQVLDGEILAVALLSAHMIIFWLSQDSNVTPPVCLTAFTAAAIAKTPPMATGLASWKVAKGLYVVPLLFAYTPLLGGDWVEMLTIFGFALVGLYALAGALQGHMENHLSWPLRILVAILGATLLWPALLIYKLIALAAFTCLILVNVKADKTREIQIA